MKPLRHTSINDPAETIDALLEFLLEHDAGQYLYRGQVSVWPEPLFPSAFRKYRRTGKSYSRKSFEYGLSLRMVGNSFTGLLPINTLGEMMGLFLQSDTALSPHEIKLIDKLRNDQYLARALQYGYEALFDVLTDEEIFLFKRKFERWKQVLDYEHKVQIRDTVFLRPFGYLLGHALAQHYGFDSEMLDVTSDPLVAGFFATKPSPGYDRQAQEGIGIMYRFDRAPMSVRTFDFRDVNFYSSPPCVSVFDMISIFFRDGAPTESMHAQVVDFLRDLFRRGVWRDWEAFRVSSGLLGSTRIGRQKAELLVPDILYVGSGPKNSPIHEFMALEDLATRDGTLRFYFSHSSHDSKYITHDREYLWPNEEDAFYAMIRNILTVNVTMDNGQIMPNRIDLLDHGYSQEVEASD